MSLAKALPPNVKIKVAGNGLEFRTIGLDVWSSFSDFVVAQRSKRIHAMPIDNMQKALMLKELINEGVDMMALLTEAQTLEGMSWLVCECCVTKGAKRSDLEKLLPVTQVPNIFTKISDIEHDEDEMEEAQAELGNDSSGPKTGAS
jgi:hypothetical protein